MAKSTKTFKTEVKDLLNLVINSLYSNKDIFLRELVSNASDAIDKRKFEALSNKDLTAKEDYIKIFTDEAKKTLTIVDNGIGMNKQEVEENIGTIAKSGTKKFIEQIKDSKKKFDSELIGQFGVGFYSAFMVAKKITLKTLKAGEKKGVIWSSTGSGSYSIDDVEKKDYGTEIILTINDESMDYLKEYKIREIISKYSSYLSYPVKMDISREEKPKDKDGKEIEDSQPETVIEEVVLNKDKALWLRDKKDIKEDEYHQFYKHISSDWTNPSEIIHYNVEGTMEFKSILFIPSQVPQDLFSNIEKRGVHLYVKKIFISDDCKKLMPEYLRFIKGVVDSSDLPLNVSREILQEDRLLDKMSKHLVNKVLDTLKNLKENDYPKYSEFYKNFGKVLKEGIYSDFANKKKLEELLLFESTNTKDGEWTSLKDYVARMPEDQKEIYYITGASRLLVENSPYLEALKKKKYEVLFFIDPIDEWLIQSLNEYDSKTLKSVLKGEVDIDPDTKKKDPSKKDKKNLDLIKEHLDKYIQEVRFSSRLTDSTCCLVADENAMTANMERIFKAMNQQVPPSKRILELNKDHKLVKKILATEKKALIKDYATLLYNQALLLEGSPIENPMLFTKKITELMLNDIK